MTETVSLEVAIEVVLRNGPTFETIAGLCKMAVEADRLAQPEQEPEAWYDKHGMVTHDPFEGVTPLYTPPPQRTWVGLTENEFKQIMLDTYNIDLDVPGHSSDDHLLWKAIEEKLRSKNT